MQLVCDLCAYVELPLTFFCNIDPALVVSRSLLRLFVVDSDTHIQGIIATVVQLFFAWRVKVLTGNWWLVIFICITACTSICTWAPPPEYRTYLTSSPQLTFCFSWWLRYCSCHPLRAGVRRVPQIPRGRDCLAHWRRYLRQHYHPLSDMAFGKLALPYLPASLLTRHFSAGTRLVSPARTTFLTRSSGVRRASLPIVPMGS